MKKQTIVESIIVDNVNAVVANGVLGENNGFIYKEFPLGASDDSVILTNNLLIFFIEGSCKFACNQYVDRLFTAGDAIFIAASSEVYGLALEPLKVVYTACNFHVSSLSRQYFEHLCEHVPNIKYDFTPLKMNTPLSSFVNSLSYYLNSIGSRDDLQEMKRQELFLILRMYYTKEQLAQFFYPIIGRNIAFKSFVLENYVQCQKLDDLIQMSNMCSNVFMRKFKSEFGVSAYQWMLEQKCKRIERKAMQSGVTVKELMLEVGIESPTHFNRVCKRYFNKTPKNLILFYQAKLCSTP